MTPARLVLTLTNPGSQDGPEGATVLQIVQWCLGDAETATRYFDDTVSSPLPDTGTHALREGTAVTPRPYPTSV
jgi:hypothetical protein